MKSKYSKTTRQLLDEIRQNQLDETITAVKNKAKKTGMPYSILKKVYDRGMAAWKGGHRPGATQVQWALARVNSFVTKSSGTWGGADKDLAKKVRAAEEFEFTVCEKCGGEECVCEEFEKENVDEGLTTNFNNMMKILAVKGGYKSTSNNGYEAIDDYRNGQGKFKKQGKKSIKQVQDWIFSSGYKIDTKMLKGILGEGLELEEGKMSEIDRMSKDGKSAEEIAKALKLDVKAVKSVLGEADLSKKQIKMVHKVADDLPKKGFKDRYGKDKGDAVRFGTATNMVKKKLGIDEEDINELTVSVDKVTKAKNIAKKMAGNMTGAVREIEKIMKGLSDVSFVKQALAKYNEDLELQERAPRRGDWQVNSQKKDTPIKNIDHFATKKQADDFAAKVKKDGGKVDSITQLEAVEESSWEKNKNILPPHLKKLFDKDGNLKNPKSQAVFDKMIKDAGGPAGFIKKHKLREEDLPEACWTGFKQVGMKKKGGKMVPNCVPTEDLDAQPQDKDVKKVKGTQPKKYYKDLKKDTKKKRADFFKNRPDYKKSDDDDDYKAAPGDKTAKTKPSTFTKKFKKMYGEEQLNEFTAAQIKTLEREYAPLKGRRMSPEQLNKMTGMIKKMTKDQLNKLAQASIPFVTSTAKSELVINRGMKWTDFKEGLKKENVDKEPTSATVSKKTDDKEKLKQEIEKLEKENQLLKVKNLEKSQKTVEPNKDTGEVPLKVGLAQKIIKDMRDGKKYKMKEKETTKLKGIGTGKTKIEIDPKMDISPSAGGNAQAASNN